MISLVLASLPIELIDLAWTNSFDKFFYGKMLDYFEAHLKSVNKFRFSYNVKLTELNEIRGSDMPKLLSDLQPDWKEALLNSIYDRKQSGKLGKGEEKFLDTLSTRFNTVCIDESENKDALIEK